MKWILRDMKAAMLAGMLLCLMPAPVFPQSAGSENPAAPPRPAGSSLPVIHYHYHVHNYGRIPTQAVTYPNYATPYTAGAWNPYNPMPPSTAAPTQAQPYPPGYILGPYAPLGFQNAAPGAPPAQGVIHVFLPTSHAAVYLNGQKMRGEGKDRKFTTPVLQSNKEYQYWVTATFKQNGESVTQYRKVVLGAGEYNVADFTRPPEENPIRLPAGPVDPNTVAPDNN
jgi:uncharacterized protein (TIGR03000 family)